ncbi:MAG: polymerase, sigma 70 subunit, RpoD family [Verrucomicrobiales bacterium]|nr:polymerase, sigma 70 subunit, RpoD family [Verrucomicrobiales bacterium]
MKTTKRNRPVKTAKVQTPGLRTYSARIPKKARNEASSELVASPVRETPTVDVPPPTPAESAHGDSLLLYMREVGQVNLLTPAEEMALAKRILKGDDKAREHMIKANLRLVVKIAKEYEGLGLPLLDLINEGNIGLMKGIDRFDPTKGAKLSTYAAWWIKQGIRRALMNQSKTIRVPVHVIDKLAHIRKAEMKLRDEFQREPTSSEVGFEVGLDAKQVERYQRASMAPISLDAPIGDDEDSGRIADIIADQNATAPDEELVGENDADLMREMFSGLPEREQIILQRRFGMDGEDPQTLEEIGARLGVTRERIRQIQDSALKKLRRKMEQKDTMAKAI